MLRPVDARGWSCESYSERVALLELIEAKRGSKLGPCKMLVSVEGDTQ